MGKCNVCGKTISDFSAKCPYCGYVKDEMVDADVIRFKRRLSKKSVLIHFVLSLMVLCFFEFTDAFYRFHSLRSIDIVRTILYMICGICAISLIRRHNIIASRKDKAFLGFAIGIGILFALLGDLYCVYLGRSISWAKIFSYSIVYGIYCIWCRVLLAAMWTTILVEIRFLLSGKQ